MQKIRIGAIGAGSMGQCAHLQHYAVLEACEVVSLAELRPGLRDQVAARYGIAHTYENHRQLIGAGGFDALVVIQPFTIHGSLLPEVFAAGVPVMTEKPIGLHPGIGRTVVEAANKAGVEHYVGYHKRSDPATIAARRLIVDAREQRLGAMRYVRITMPPGDWIAGGFDGLIHSNEPVEGSAEDAPPPDLDEARRKQLWDFVNYYIHQVNLLRHLLGEEYTVDHVTADRRLLVARSASGRSAVIEMAPWQTTTGWQESALVGFDHGWLRIDLPAPLATVSGALTVFRDQGERAGMEQPTIDHTPAMRRQAELFVAAVRGESTPLCRGDEALRDLEIADRYLAALVASTVAAG